MLIADIPISPIHDDDDNNKRQELGDIHLLDTMAAGGVIMEIRGFPRGLIPDADLAKDYVTSRCRRSV